MRSAAVHVYLATPRTGRRDRTAIRRVSSCGRGAAIAIASAATQPGGAPPAIRPEPPSRGSTCAGRLNDERA